MKSLEGIEIFNRLLEKDYFNTPTSWNLSFSSITESPFSDKLIAYNMSSLSAFGLGRYGLSASQCTRKDIPLTFLEAGSEVTQYAKDWFDILLDNNWLERISKAVDRKELICI